MQEKLRTFASREQITIDKSRERIKELKKQLVLQRDAQEQERIHHMENTKQLLEQQEQRLNKMQADRELEARAATEQRTQLERSLSTMEQELSHARRELAELKKSSSADAARLGGSLQLFTR